MARILGSQITTKSLMIRLLAGVVNAAIIFQIFAQGPGMLTEMLARTSARIELGMPPLLPVLGTLLAAVGFVGVLLRKTKVDGVLNLIYGLLLTSYLYLLLQGGRIPIQAYFRGVTVSAVLELQLLFSLILIPPLLVLAKGVILMIGAALGRWPVERPSTAVASA